MGIYNILITAAGLAYVGYGIYLIRVRSQRESWLDRAARQAWGDKQIAPNPHDLRNNLYVGFFVVILGFALAALGLVAE